MLLLAVPSVDTNPARKHSIDRDGQERRSRRRRSKRRGRGRKWSRDAGLSKDERAHRGVVWIMSVIDWEVTLLGILLGATTGQSLLE